MIRRVILSLALAAPVATLALQSGSEQVPEQALRFEGVEQPWKMPSDVYINSPLCDGDQHMIFSFADKTWNYQLVSVGRSAPPVSFDYKHSGDIANTRFRAMDALDGDVTVLFVGQGTSTFDRPSSGRDSVLQNRSTFLDRFSSKGELKKTVELDLPFTPQKFAAIADDKYLFLGPSKVNGDPMAAIVDSSGDLKRYLDLPLPSGKSLRDELLKSEAAIPGLKDTSDEEQMYAALSSYAFVHEGKKLILYRPWSIPDVIELDPGGASRKVRLKMPSGGVQLESILPSNGGNWVAKGIVGENVLPYLLEFDPMAGNLIRKLTTGDVPASTIMCVDDGRFIGLRWQSDKTFLLESQR